jgi:hypothetical protein
MGLFDRNKEETPVPEPPKKEESFPEPPKPTDEGLGGVKERVEEIPEPSMMEEPKVEDSEVLEEELEEVSEELSKPEEPVIPEPLMPTTVSPTLYLKLTEYKEVVEATNKLRKDIEKLKKLVSELRTIEKDEHSKLEKSEELIMDIDKIIALFEKTMVTPIE